MPSRDARGQARAHRLHPRLRALVPALATVAAVALFVAAGNWQRERMHGKQALQAAYEQASRTAAGPLPAIAAGADARELAALRYLRVQVHGRFDAASQILVDNRVHEGRAGYAVVAPLLLDDGRRVLVDRGWIAVGASRATVPKVAVPEDEVDVEGRIAVPALRYFELAPDARPMAVWQHLDPTRFRQVTGIDVLPIVIEQTGPAREHDAALSRTVAAPDFGIDMHRIYMVQWYSFAALALVLFAVLQLKPWWQAWRKA